MWKYTYIYRRPDGTMDLSLERYRFDGELSWARYIIHEIFVSPDVEGDVIQGFDGKSSWVIIDGVPTEDPKVVRLAAFGRRTNYYWFAMMPKLLDPGVRHDYQGTRTVDGITYDLIHVTFDKSVGASTDRYLLYVNQKTGLVDRFLFTVVDLKMTKPYLMKVTNEEVDGLLLPTGRKYVPSAWDRKPAHQDWVNEIMVGIHFSNRFSVRDFER